MPGTGRRFRSGGLAVELQTARLVAGLCAAEVVTYRQRESDRPHLDDLLASEPPDAAGLWVVSWGFDVPALLRRLRGRRVAYHAHSSGYGFDLPAGVPVLAASRNTLGYWGDRAPRNPLFLVPNALEPAWLERGARPGRSGAELERPVDVLVQARKSSGYVLRQLVPALRRAGLRVTVQDGWVDDLVALFNSAAVYLYDSAEYWRGRGVSEGFGLPPLEAMACGCVVFSSLNHALADLFEPGLCGHQIGCGTLAWDVERIRAAARDPWSQRPPADLLEPLLHRHSEAALAERWRQVLSQLAGWFATVESSAGAGGVLRSPPIWRLRAGQRWRSARTLVGRLARRLLGPGGGAA
ncbi:glycosyltransferase [Synechococcus sp. RSCCF101]|uniref:glycosyltransferase n=1 Tax=Synechococcus sp. RSCCF101 TaxID=2511069 RepID=UPI001245C6BF|nr:glycosyltransferase [Synechococcus sp. RSCCF101]QEY32443.1 glycosyltransferase [Synechococcus sp. RSCCF101]